MNEAMDRLWAQRFADLPRYCGNEIQPGNDEVEEWRDWTDLETTPDQLRIENVIDRVDLNESCLLHVGVGNSGFAQRFSARVNRVVGTTISSSEKRHADGLEIPNYTVYLHNKYQGSTPDGFGQFDFIIDNNPSSFACCGDHFSRMMIEYRRNLKKGGVIITDRVGLGWVVSASGANPRWKFDFDDWAAIGGAFGLQAEKIDSDVYILAEDGPAARRRIVRPLLQRVLSKLAHLIG